MGDSSKHKSVENAAQNAKVMAMRSRESGMDGKQHDGENWLRAAPLAQIPWLHEEVARRLWSRAECIRTPVQQWLQLGAGRDAADVPNWLVAKHPQAQGVRLAAPYGRVDGSLLSLMQTQQLAVETVDLLWSNLQLHWLAQPVQWLQQWRSVLRPQGYVMFSCFGPDTLRKLRDVYTRQGWSAPAQSFVDMHDIGDMLLHAGFSDPVVDMEKLHLHFSDASALRAELRELGRNTASRRSSATRGRRWLREWDTVVKEGLAGADGRLYLEIEVIYGHAFCMGDAPTASVAEPSDGAAETRIGLEEMRQKLRERGLP